MNAGSKLALGGLAGLLAWLGVHGACLAGAEDAPPSAAADADADANPYSAITGKNVFRLNPPPPPPEPPKPPAPRLPEIKLSGFTRTGDKWKVLLAVTTDNPDPHGPKLSSYLTLAEGDKKEVGTGDKKGMVELVKLYSGEEKIDIINSGSPMTLSMKDNGFVIPPPVQVASAAVTNVSRAAPIASPAGTTNSLGNPWPVSPAHPMRAGGGASPAHTEPGTDPKPGSGDTPVRGGPSAISPNPSPNRGASNNRSGLIISGSGEDR